MASKAPKELPEQVRLDRAIDEYQQALSAYENSSDPQKKKPSIRSIAKYYGLIHTTLSRRIDGRTQSHQQAHEDEQRLSPVEEQALKSWILQLCEWGWPPRVALVRQMACELLEDKKDHQILVCSKYDLQAYKAQDGSREWASLIECISADGRLLPMFVIFKGKRQMKAWFEVLEDKDTCIAVSENGWTNNVLGLEWFIRCFEPQTRKTLKGRYRLLIFDGHSSHISRKVIQFCASNDIVLLWLPAHATHILQPLDVGFFGPLASAYRRHLEENTRYGGGYTMDKTDFLLLIQMARKNAATKQNIEHAWQKSGLFPIQPQIILDKLGLKAPESEELDPTKPPEITITASDNNSISVPFTPANVKQVNQLVQEIKAGNHDPALPEKLGKACSSALAASILPKSTNNDLVQANQRKMDKAKRGQGHWGEGQILNLEIVQQRLDDLAAKQFEKEFKRLLHLGPHLFEDTKKDRSPVKRTTNVPVAPGPLIPITLPPPQAPQIPPQALSQAPSQRGQRGGRGGSVRRRMTKEEDEEEDAPTRFSRIGRPIRPKRR